MGKDEKVVEMPTVLYVMTEDKAKECIQNYRGYCGTWPRAPPAEPPPTEPRPSPARRPAARRRPPLPSPTPPSPSPELTALPPF